MEKFHGSSGNWCSEFNRSSSSSSSPFVDSTWTFQSCFSGTNSVGFLGIESSLCKEERAESASRSHRQSEKRRRDRINSHLAALRKLIPDSDKMDKAALLASVINHVKELKQKATETEDFSALPTETDEVTIVPNDVSRQDTETENVVQDTRFRVSICCEDQPESLSEFARVLNKLQLRTIRAEIVTVGGRMRSDLILSGRGCIGIDVSVQRIKQSIRIALSRTSSLTSLSSSCGIRSKRQRWFLSSQYP